MVGPADRPCPAVVGRHSQSQRLSARTALPCGCRLGVLDRGSHWCHLPNTIEPSMCDGDAALCRITLTVCLFFRTVMLHLLFWLLAVLESVLVRTLTSPLSRSSRPTLSLCGHPRLTIGSFRRSPAKKEKSAVIGLRWRRRFLSVR